MNKKTVRDIDVKGKRILMRVDFNVPMDENGHITDESRIVGALPTIEYLVNQKAKVVLCSHMGRPKGEFNKKYSLAPVAKRLGELLKQEVAMAKDVSALTPTALSPRCRRAGLLCLKTSVFTRRRRRMTRLLQPSWLPMATSMSTTRSARRTAPTPARKAWRTICPPFPVS